MGAIAFFSHHKTPNAHREQLYGTSGSPKAATQPYRLRSADGAFWSHMTQPYYRFSLVHRVKFTAREGSWGESREGAGVNGLNAC